jgi:cytochrome c oxidase subunit 2
MAISPPTERLWWKSPIHRPELVWIIVAFLWGLVMFFMMIWWHATGEQNLATESYRTTPNDYFAKTEAMVQQYKVRDINGVPVAPRPWAATST